MSNDSLGDRMKAYEDLHRVKLMKRIPVVIRIDGKAFHTFLRNAKKPFDDGVITAMSNAAEHVIREIGGTARLAYIQSDECSIILNNALDILTTAWFDNNLQKMASVAASIFTAHFNTSYVANNLAYFDARAFGLPDLNEVTNYLIWRQQDATRNSIRMYASTLYSHHELDGVSNAAAQEMMFVKGLNWNNVETRYKRGFVVTKNIVDFDIPVFTSDRDYIKNLYLPKDDIHGSVVS